MSFLYKNNVKEGCEDVSDVIEVGEIDEMESSEESQFTEKEDPQSEENFVSEETGAETEITQILVSENTFETEETTIGIDVSKFQGTIDWVKVAESGLDFAMVRGGYRTQSTGEITEDTIAR